jgi:hypothetical protein
VCIYDCLNDNCNKLNTTSKDHPNVKCFQKHLVIWKGMLILYTKVEK